MSQITQNENLKFELQEFEKIKLHKADLIYSCFSLHFCNPEKFNDMMNEMEKYYIIAQKMVELRKYTNKENINKLTQDEKNKLNKELNEYKNEMQTIMLFIETNEMCENLDEASSIFNEINELIKLLNNQK